jgi:hypothetical protein
MSLPANRRSDPPAVLPRWLVADMLSVAALELGHPVSLLVLVEAYNLTLHCPFRALSRRFRLPSESIPAEQEYRSS